MGGVWDSPTPTPGITKSRQSSRQSMMVDNSYGYRSLGFSALVPAHLPPHHKPFQERKVYFFMASACKTCRTRNNKIRKMDKEAMTACGERNFSFSYEKYSFFFLIFSCVVYCFPFCIVSDFFLKICKSFFLVITFIFITLCDTFSPLCILKNRSILELS